MDDREPLRLEEFPREEEDREDDPEEEAAEPTKSPLPAPANPEKSRFNGSTALTPDDADEELEPLRDEEDEDEFLFEEEPDWLKTVPTSKTVTQNTKIVIKPNNRTTITCPFD